MITVRLPEEDEDVDNLPHFDHTKMSAINTCPKWGIIRYHLHKTFSNSARAMALEAGEACHQVFSAGRVFDLYNYGNLVYPNEPYKDLAVTRSVEMFGADRTEQMMQRFTMDGEDERTRLLNGAIFILESSGFYDDPSDRRRTLDNLIEACIAYLDRYEFGANVPYIRGDFVGIENAFRIIIEGDEIGKIAFTGRIDGFHCRKNNHNDPYIEENKTASRLSDAWEQSFDTSHQVTGYTVAGSTIIGSIVDRAVIRGVQIPQPKVYSDGVVSVTVTRKNQHFQQWANWVNYTVKLFREFYEQPVNAPMFTHSCNRFFRPCSFIPLCCAPIDEQEEIINEEMVVEEWSPLHDKAGD